MRKTATEILWLFILLALILIMGSLLIGGDILIFLARAWCRWCGSGSLC